VGSPWATPLSTELKPGRIMLLDRIAYYSVSKIDLLLQIQHHGLCVCWSRSWALQKRLNRSRCRLRADSGGPSKPRIRWGRDPPLEGAIFGVIRPTEKHWQSVTQPLHSSKSVITTRGTAATGCNAPYWSVSYYIVPCENSATAMRPFVKILWPLVSN